MLQIVPMYKHLFTSLFLQDLSVVSLMQKFIWRLLVLLELNISYIFFLLLVFTSYYQVSG